MTLSWYFFDDFPDDLIGDLFDDFFDDLDGNFNGYLFDDFDMFDDLDCDFLDFFNWNLPDYFMFN